MIQKTRGGLCAPAGFLCGSISSGIKNPKATRLDTALIVSARPCASAATFTTNVVKAAPVLVSMDHMKTGKVRAIVLNSGNANACTGPAGLADSRRMAKAAAQRTALAPEQVVVGSTGRIGVSMPIARIEDGISRIRLSRGKSRACAQAIMTSDTFPKEIALSVKTRSGTFHIGGIAKGAGMIDPNMATMLCVVTTDALLSQAALRQAVRASVETSFNRITVDGDMSTNDTVFALANGASGIRPPAAVFQKALDTVTQSLARMIVKDGEGVSKFIEIVVRGAASPDDAKRAAEAVANSTLVKCAWAGGDPNWGRIMDALGYSGARMREDRTKIFYDNLPIVTGGTVAGTPWAKLRAVARKKEFRIVIDLAVGKSSHIVWTTDLTEEYVRLNLGE
ncbi:MAG TPA: bifunctional glutamate N-acetyltransferase/amino-acid acetyltransferase ArgJ [Terrimicrobiaceae bacterium]|nr:bifunctional glutamate N-acetyltransferase/amino-acid acetyltransferase ArgJ [Terrimicrobiaceae bacterium]